MIMQILGVLAALPFTAASTFPNGPFTTSDSWIIGQDGSNYTYAGVNWPGHEAAMVPEGLQYQSIETIVSRIKSLGMNSIRLTYATEMVDQIYDNKKNDVPIMQSLVDALGQDNGTAIFDKIVEKNPSFNADTTRLQVYDAIAEECARQSIYVHLDNHVSKAKWCCDPWDGNTWWNDDYFSPTNWTRGLSYMASHGKTWPNLMSMSLYNELRPSFNQTSPSFSKVTKTYNWAFWYKQIKRGTRAVHDTNPDALIFLSGMLGDMDLQPVVDGTALTPSKKTFDSADFAGYRDKLVLELHSYGIISKVDNCPKYNDNLFEMGYSAQTGTGTGNTTNRFPVVMSEWGFTNDDVTWRSPNDTYATCVQRFLKDIVPGAGWMIWTIGGSYYTRQGDQDHDEVWGLLNHDWSDWRSPGFIEGGLKPLVTTSLSKVNSSTGSPSGSGVSTKSAGSFLWDGTIIFLAVVFVVCFMTTL